MTPYDYAMSRECEFIGGPIDGMIMPVANTTGMYKIPCLSHEVIGVKDCGVPRSVSPHYNRINDRRFQFVGYR